MSADIPLTLASFTVLVNIAVVLTRTV